MKTDFQYDVFLSHNKADKPWVRGLYYLLKNQNLKVFFDEESIDFGDDTVTALDKALDGSRHILLVVTPNSMASRWVALEASVSIYADPNAATKKLIPILLEPTPPEQIPATVRRLNTVDLTNPSNRTTRLKKLLKQLGISVADTLELPVWPTIGEDSFGGEGRDAKDIFRFRNPAVEWYVARGEQELARKAWLKSSSAAANLLITGRTGVGKSSFLNWFINWAMNEGCAVIQCVPNSDRVDDLLIQLARQETDLLSAHDIKAPALGGIPKLDHQNALAKLLQKSQKHIVIVIDQIERLFPYAATSTGDIYNTWRMLMESLGDFKRNNRVTWVLAVKEWYFLMLFPNEIQLRMDNFTYISLGDLNHEQSVTLVRRLATLSGVTIGDREVDLLVTKTGGRPLTLVLCFLVAVERSRDKGSIAYDYLNKTEPWNDIFAADYARLQSQRQRCVVLALAFSKKEVIPEDEVIRRVQNAERCSRSEIEKEIQMLDQDYGLLVRNEGFVSFVHSGFGVFIDNTYAAHYPNEWFARSVGELDEARRREFQFIETDYVGNILAMFAHNTANSVVSAQFELDRLSQLLAKGELQNAQEVCNHVKESIGRVLKVIREFRDLRSRRLSDPNASTVLLDAVEEARRRQLRYGKASIDIQVSFTPETDKLRVPGEVEKIIDVFAVLFQNSCEHSGLADLLITVECFWDPSTKKVICDVRDNGRGLSPNIKERIFQPFFTTSLNHTGLGLATVKRVMEASGGSIREIGVEGQGAVFRLEFPAFEIK